MTTKELGQLFPIVIEEYSEQRTGLYEIEKILIEGSFTSSEIVYIDHIGSTTIPGFKAKPTIDNLLQVSEQVVVKKTEHVLIKQDNFPVQHDNKAI